MALSCLSSRMCTQGSKLQCILNPLSASFWPNTRMRKWRGNPSFKIKWELQVSPLFWGWNSVELSKWRWPCLIGKAIFKTLLLFLRTKAQCCSERKILHLSTVRVVTQCVVKIGFHSQLKIFNEFKEFLWKLMI